MQISEFSTKWHNAFAGVLQLEKQRPVDVLAGILEGRSAQQLEGFFRAYGAPEVAAMLLLLLTHSTTAQPNPVSLNIFKKVAVI